MGIPVFDEWSRPIAKSFDLKFLKDCTIGIDSTHFIESLPKKTLQSALGGTPLCLESNIISSINDLHSAGLKLHFVFNGLDSGIGPDPVVSAARAAQLNHDAFSFYEARHGKQANDLFELGVSDAASVSEMLKKTLHEQGILFTVAPYSALAQLVYLEKHPSQYIDAVYGPSDLFCLGIDKVITQFIIKPTESSFVWIDRRDCLAESGNPSSHILIDAFMLAGSSVLPIFPPFMNQAIFPKPPTFRHIVSEISNSGNVVRLCARYLTDPAVKGSYLDQYKRAMTRVKHHVVITAEGDVEALDKEHAPDDVHECVGLRLPEELYMYMSRGMLRPRVLNWLTSGKINITQPLAGGDGQPYQDLVKTQLDPLRRQALSLLTEPMHRYFHSRDITTRLWFEPTYDGKFNMKNLPSVRDQLSKWNVRYDLIADFSSEYMPPGSLSFALVTLGNVDYAAKTVTPKPKGGQEPMKHRDEILANVVWRFLQLRGYVNDQHQLTAWGKILETALDAAGTRKDQEEAVFIAVELLRFELVSPETMFLGYAGAPENGNDTDKRNAMMVSRVACLGKIRHGPKGYSGPLSRHLLAYQSIISNVQASLRDLMEMILTAMFLEGSINRDRDDWMDLSLGLPFYEEHSCALGILTMHYLDDLCLYPNPVSEGTRKEVREKGQKWILNSDFSGSLDDAFKIWDALYKGVRAAGDRVKYRQMWDEVNDWLSQRS